jgi:CRP-like cAMP-binding protein
MRARRGLLLIAAGTRSDDVFLLVSGRLRVTLFSADGREVIIRDLLPGQFVGDLAALDGDVRSATIVALDDSNLLRLSGEAFRRAVMDRPEAALWYARTLARRIRDLTDRLFEMGTLNVRSRLHAQLLRLCAEAGLDGSAAALDPAPTHEHLATLIGTHREAVTRELSYLASVGLVERGRGRLVVKDVARLSALVSKALGLAERFPMPAEGGPA